MSFSELPTEVQVVAAKTLSNLLLSQQNSPQKKEPVELAREVGKAFTELHSPSESFSIQNGND